MTQPNDTRALVARLAEHMCELARVTDQSWMWHDLYAIAAAAREAETGQVAEGNDGEATADDHMATGPLRGAPPASAPSPADDVETVRHHLTLNVRHTIALAALDRLAARLARFEALAERAHDYLQTTASRERSLSLVEDLAALRREGR